MEPSSPSPAFNPTGIGMECALFGSMLMDSYSRRETNHSLGENSEKCFIDFDLRPSRRGTEKFIFSVLLPTLRLHGERLEGGGCVSD